MSLDPAVLPFAAAGMCVGALMIVPTQRAIRETPSPPAGLMISIVATSVLFAVLAARFGPTVHAGPALALATVGPPLALVDVLERRLPTSLVATGFALGLGAVAAEAIVTGTPGLIGRAATSALLVGGAYLALALAARGGLGSGDVRLGTLVGLVLGPSGWASVLAATAVTWLLAAAVVLAANARHGWRGHEIPLGPFLVVGAISGALCSEF